MNLRCCWKGKEVIEMAIRIPMDTLSLQTSEGDHRCLDPLSRSLSPKLARFSKTKAFQDLCQEFQTRAQAGQNEPIKTISIPSQSRTTHDSRAQIHSSDSDFSTHDDSCKKHERSSPILERTSETRAFTLYSPHSNSRVCVDC